MPKLSRHRRNWNTLFTGLIRLGLFLLFLGFIALGGLYYVYAKKLPTDAQLTNWKRDEATRILDRNGNLLYEIHGDQRRTVVASDAISPYLKEATIAIEDRRYYEHHGIDPKGILRATYNNLRDSETIEGGSTITQQLAKNAFLTPKRTIARKIQEALLAIKLERHYSKEQILTLYLNQVNYGSNAYGAEAASNMYFQKSAKDLTLNEAAMLAALTKSPSYLSPYGDKRPKLEAREKLVLYRMYVAGYISANDLKNQANKQVTVKPREEKIQAPHFVMYVRQLLVDKYGEDTVEKGGLEVTTTLDPGKQKIAEEVVQNADPILRRSNASNTALVAIDPKNGQIVAMVGSRDYFDAAHDGNVNVVTSTRPPGSSFKPIVYAAAFEQGPWSPASTLFDVETDFGDKYKAYMPKNYDSKFHGPVSIREALANSYNIPAVKIMALLGKDKTIAAVQNVGITTFNNADNFGLSLVLGGGDVRMLELAGAYGAFANRGAFHPPVAIMKITQHGKTLFEQSYDGKTVLRPQVAYEISSILSDAKAREPIFGRGGPLTVPGHTVAVKTGTTSEYRDAWTIGYTPSIVAAVWVGNNNYSPMKSGSAGAMAAAPIWNAFMTKILTNTTDEAFELPSDIQTITVDAITGQKPTSGTRRTRQDIAAPWQVPRESIQLASYKVFDCHGSVKESKNIPVAHSEKPDDPKWEKPVLDWARANGYAVGALADVHETCEPEPPVQLVSDDTNNGVGGSDILPVTPPPSPDTPQTPPSDLPTPTPPDETPDD